MRENLSGVDVVDHFGRLYFLQEAEKVWDPRPLVTLAKSAQVSEWIRADSLMATATAESVPDFLAQVVAYGTVTHFTWERLCGEHGALAIGARHALLRWSHRYRIASADTWVLDVALQTFAASMLGEQEFSWLYCLRPSAPFKAPPLYREPGEQDPQMLRRGLNLYRRAFKTWQASTELAQRENMKVRRDARWTAMAYAGKTRFEISKEITSGKDPENAVTRAVLRFCKRIRLERPSTLGEPWGAQQTKSRKTA